MSQTLTTQKFSDEALISAMQSILHGTPELEDKQVLQALQDQGVNTNIQRVRRLMPEVQVSTKSCKKQEETPTTATANLSPIAIFWGQDISDLLTKALLTAPKGDRGQVQIRHGGYTSNRKVSYNKKAGYWEASLGHSGKAKGTGKSPLTSYIMDPAADSQIIFFA